MTKESFNNTCQKNPSTAAIKRWQEAIGQKDMKYINSYLKKYQKGAIDVLCPNYDCPALFRMAIMGELEMVKFLINNGADINKTSRELRQTPFMVACQEGQLHVAKYIYSLGGIDINQKDISGLTALHCACFRGHVAIVNFLLDSGADKTIIDNHKSYFGPVRHRTARDIAVERAEMYPEEICFQEIIKSLEMTSAERFWMWQSQDFLNGLSDETILPSKIRLKKKPPSPL